LGKGRRKRAEKRQGKDRRLGPLTKIALAIFAFFLGMIILPYWLSPGPASSPQGAGPEYPLPPTEPEADVGIVDQFYSQSPNFTDETVGLLEGLNLRVKVYRDKEVTVELYRRLPTIGSKLIILRVHAGVSEGLDNSTFLFTAEEYSTSEYVIEQLLDQVMPGFMSPDPDEKPVFSVSPTFIRLGVRGEFQGTTIILSSCFGLYRNHLAEAFQARGARVFISWDERVSLGHTDKATLRLLKALLVQGMPVREAVAEVMEEVGPDPIYEGFLGYYPFENGNHVLSLSSIRGMPIRPRLIRSTKSRALQASTLHSPLTRFS